MLLLLKLHILICWWRSPRVKILASLKSVGVFPLTLLGSGFHPRYLTTLHYGSSIVLMAHGFGDILTVPIISTLMASVSSLLLHTIPLSVCLGTVMSCSNMDNRIHRILVQGFWVSFTPQHILLNVGNVCQWQNWHYLSDLGLDCTKSSLMYR